MIKSVTKAYQYLVYFGAYLKSPLLLLCRLYFGWKFLMSGWGKFQNIDQFASQLDQMGFILPTLQAYTAAGIELVGGFFLAIGLASRLVAIPLGTVMIVAYLAVHHHPFADWIVNPGLIVKEPPFNFLLTCLLVFAFGPGRFSVDYYIEKWLFHRAQEVPTHQRIPKS